MEDDLSVRAPATDEEVEQARFVTGRSWRATFRAITAAATEALAAGRNAARRCKQQPGSQGHTFLIADADGAIVDHCCAVAGHGGIAGVPAVICAQTVAQPICSASDQGQRATHNDHT